MVFSGSWRADRTAYESIVALLEEWSTDRRFLSLSVRAAGHGEVSVDFVYTGEAGEAGDLKRFASTHAEQLRAAIGDAFHSADVGSVQWLSPTENRAVQGGVALKGR